MFDFNRGVITFMGICWPRINLCILLLLFKGPQGVQEILQSQCWKENL